MANLYSLEVNSIIVIADTKNLIADARFGGNSGDVLMVGAHLDSVPEGPGWLKRRSLCKEGEVVV